VLLVASDLEPYDEQRGAQVGADGIIKKPFSPHDLIAMVAKFTGLREAPASLPALAETLVDSSPMAPPEVSPMGIEPDGATGRQESLLVPTEPFPGLALDGTPEPTPEPRLEGATEPTPTAPELISETGLEATPETTRVAAEPTPEPIPEAAPEPVPVSPESISETVVEPTSELASVVSEPPVAESGVPCAPVSVTETVHPPAEGAPEVPSAVPAEELLLIVEGQHPKPMAASSLDSFSLAEAAEGRVYIAPPEAEMAPSPEAGVVQPGEVPEPPPPVINSEWVYVIVRKVVMKMAPPVLPPELVGELIRALTEEITAELNSESSQPY